MTNTQAILTLCGLATPFILLVISMLRGISKGVTDLRIDVAKRSARQDTTLDDHERRITRLEDQTV